MKTKDKNEYTQVFHLVSLFCGPSLPKVMFSSWVTCLRKSEPLPAENNIGSSVMETAEGPFPFLPGTSLVGSSSV